MTRNVRGKSKEPKAKKKKKTGEDTVSLILSVCLCLLIAIAFYACLAFVIDYALKAQAKDAVTGRILHYAERTIA